MPINEPRTLFDSTYRELVNGSIDSPRTYAWYQVRELATRLGISRTTDDPLPEDQQEENPLSPPGSMRSKTIAELWPEIKQKIEEEMYP